MIYLADDDDKNEELPTAPQKGNPPETGRADKPRDSGDV